MKGAPTQKKTSAERLYGIAFDLETMGTRHDARIISIGAVAFSRRRVEDSGEDAGGSSFIIHEDTFHEFANPFKQHARSDDHATGQWWSAPEQSAAFDVWQRAIKAGKTKPLPELLAAFGVWLGRARNQVEGTWGETPIWCRGPHFDVAILQDAFAECGLPFPIHFREPRDARTALGLIANPVPVSDKDIEGLIPHVAVDDAKREAIEIIGTNYHLDNLGRGRKARETFRASFDLATLS